MFLAIRPEQFDQIYLCSITRTQGDGYFFDSASLVSIGRGWGTFPFVFQRVGKKVFFAHKNVYYRAEPISKAAPSTRSTSCTIAASPTKRASPVR